MDTRRIGTAAYGVRAPIVRQGDDLVDVTVRALLEAQASGAFHLRDRDVVGVTESLLARAQGNYAPIEAVAQDASRKLTGDFAVVFPILSRNRFALILQGLALTGRTITVLLSYPCDEVGNELMDRDQMLAQGINPFTDVLTEATFRKAFGDAFKHPFTGMDYIQLYKDLGVDGNIQLVLANDSRAALAFSDQVLVASVHDRARIKAQLKAAGAKTVLGLDELLTESIAGSGYHPEYGLLGSNQAGDHLLKLFPRDCDRFVKGVQDSLRQQTGKTIEVMVYGDGAFKDPQGKIWELADPVVSPGYTAGLEGLPNELKLKYLVDQDLAGLSPQETEQALRRQIRDKAIQPVHEAASAGTTPRKITDLLGSLCDLVSGSGDKGTPIVLVQGYFDNYASG